LLFFRCFDYHLIILLGSHLFYRGSFSVFAHVIQQNFLVARKYIRRKNIQGDFKALGEYGPQYGKTGNLDCNLDY
jgi:hypothetical protein